MENSSISEHNNSQPDLSASIAQTIEVRAPRSLWLECLLGLLTLGLYYGFWLAGRVKELKQFRPNQFTPWLWFFVPLFSFAGLFAYPRLFKELKELESQRKPDNVTINWKELGALWIAAVVVIGILDSLSFKRDWPIWFDLITLILIVALFTLLQQRFQSLILAHKEQFSFRGARHNYHWVEWGVLLCLVPLWIWLAVVLFKQESARLEDLGRDYLFIDAVQGYQLDLSGEHWVRVKIGTYSDGTAEHEFSNDDNTASLIIFKHNEGDTYNSVASFRFKEMVNDFSVPPTCSEKRTLSDNQRSIISTSVCHSTARNERLSTYSTLIKVDGIIYELLGYHEGDSANFPAVKKAMLSTSASFSEVNE